MLNADRKPELDEVERYIQAMEEEFSGARRRWSSAFDFYLQEYELWPGVEPETRAQRPQFHSPRAPRIVDSATDAGTTYHPRVHRPHLSESQKAKEAAGRIEQAVQDLIFDAFENAVEHPGKTAYKYGVLGNYMGLGTLFEPMHAQEKPKRRQHESKDDFDERMAEWESSNRNPIQLVAPVPGEILMDPFDPDPPVAVRRQRMRAHRVAELAEEQARLSRTEPLWTLEKNDPHEWLEVEEVWTVRWVGRKLRGGTWLYEPRPNAWGYQPWGHAWGGGTVGRPDNPLDTYYMARGMLTPVLETIRYLDQDDAARHELMMRTAFAPLIADLPPEEAVKMIQNGIAQGDINKFGWLTPAQLPAQLFQEMEMLSNEMRLATFDPLTSGIPSTSVDTATYAMILAENSLRRFKLLNIKLGQIFSIACSKMLRLAEHVRDAYGWETLTVGRNPLRIGDIQGNHRIRITFENADPVTQRMLLEQIMTEMSMGLASKEDYWAAKGVEDTEDRKRRVLEDRVEALPEVDAQMLAVTAEKMGLDEVSRMLKDPETAQRMAAAANGRPPNGNGRTANIGRVPSENTPRV